MASVRANREMEMRILHTVWIVSAVLAAATPLAVGALDLNERAIFRRVCKAEVVKCFRECNIIGMQSMDDVWRENESLEPPLHFCMGMQEMAFGLTACRSACEGYRDHLLGEDDETRIASRWHLSKLISRVTIPLEAAGLWKGTSLSPTLADEDTTEWEEGCAAFYDNMRESCEEVASHSERGRDGCRGY